MRSSRAVTPSRAFALTALFAALFPFGALAAGDEAPAAASDAPAPASASDVEVNWNTTLKESFAVRTRKRNDVLVNGGSSAAQDDGDRNFSRGLVSARTDVFTELDLKYKGFGVRGSAAGWYDPVYHRTNDNDSPSTSQGAGASGNEFTDATKRRHGGKAEVLDAFAFASGEVGGFQSNLKLGQHTLVYGESLFFGNNGVAYGMVPIDVNKAISQPGVQFRDLALPVPQVSGQITLAPSVSLGAYYQFRWKKTRLPAAGSYLSGADMLDEGGSVLPMVPPIPVLLPNGWQANRTADREPGNSGQGGAQLRFSVPQIGTDFGVYATRYHERVPTFVLDSAAPTPPGSPLPPFLPTEYYLVYGKGVRAYGLSFSKAFDASSVAGEISVRDGAYLASDPVPAYAGGSIPRGRTLHVNLSTLTAFEPNFLIKEATAAAEIACNRTLKVTNGQPVASNSTRNACGLRVLYEPKFRQIMSGVDLATPLSVGYTHGRSSAIPFFGADKSGDVNLSFNFSYLDKWRMGLGYTHFYGPAGTVLDSTGQAYSFKQSLADRDFVSLSFAVAF